MRVQLAWRNLAQQWTRTATAAAGIGFAVLLMLVQLGFYGAVEQMATVFYGKLEFDLLVRSPEYLHFSETATIPRARLTQIAEHPAVEAVYPFDVRFNMWRVPPKFADGTRAAPDGVVARLTSLFSDPPQPDAEPRSESSSADSNSPQGRRRGILVMAIEPDDPVFRLESVRSESPRLRVADKVLFDDLSHKSFGKPGPGALAEVGARNIEVVGQYSLGTGFGADGDLITSRATFRRLFPDRTAQQASLGLVRLKQEFRGQEERVISELLERLPKTSDKRNDERFDVEILARDEVELRERKRWMWGTSIGMIFMSGVALAVVVGIVVTYQVLSSDIANRLAEFATLKAMGYHHGYLARVVVQQALLLALFGYLPGYAISLVVYEVTSALTNIPLAMTPGRSWGVLAITILMCVLASMIAVGKVRRADPAELF